MSELVLVTIVVLIAVVVLAWLFRQPLSALINRSRSVNLKVTKDGLEADFRTDLEDLARDSSATAKAVEESSPGPVGPTGSQQALPDEALELGDPMSANSGTPVTVRQLVAVGADWGGLIREAQQLLDENDIPLPQNHSSLGGLLRAFEDDRPGILPERAENLAVDADELLQKLMNIEPGEVAHEDVRLFTVALTSLHKIISKAASKARHPSRIGRLSKP